MANLIKDRKKVLSFALTLAIIVIFAPVNLPGGGTNRASACGYSGSCSSYYDYDSYNGSYQSYSSRYRFPSSYIRAYEAEYGPTEPRYRSASGILRYHRSTAERSFEKQYLRWYGGYSTF